MNTATTSTTDMTVSTTILAQLGGGRFVMMTGAKSLCGDANSLQFRLPARFAKDGINSVRVVLDADDTYTVSFHKIGRAPRFEVTLVSELSGVYADMLRDIFTKATGLETSLGTMGRK